MGHMGEMGAEGRICAGSRDALTNRNRTHMGKRGENTFKRNDGLRALKIAVDGGITPGVLEIVAKDGTIFRVYGDNVAAPKESDIAAAKAWNAEIAKLKAATPKGARNDQAASQIRAELRPLPLLPSPGIAPASPSGGRGLRRIHGGLSGTPPRSPSVPVSAASPARSPLPLPSIMAHRPSAASPAARRRCAGRSWKNSARIMVTFRWRRCRGNLSSRCSTPCHRMRR